MLRPPFKPFAPPPPPGGLRSEALTAVTAKCTILALWNLTSYIPVEVTDVSEERAVSVVKYCSLFVWRTSDSEDVSELLFDYTTLQPRRLDCSNKKSVS
jgi:hypothetical protein